MPQSITHSHRSDVDRATRVIAFRLPPSDIATLDRFARDIGCTAPQVLKLAGKALADGRVAIGADEVRVFEAVAHELRQAREAVEHLGSQLDLTDGVSGSVLDDAFAKLLAVLTAFETSARLFADRRRSMARTAVMAAAGTAARTGAGAP